MFLLKAATTKIIVDVTLGTRVTQTAFDIWNTRYRISNE